MSNNEIHSPSAIIGKIHYTSLKPGREGQERGRESFRIDIHSNGEKTLSAHAEIDDKPSVMRDVVSSLKPDFSPRACFVSISVDDTFRGSAWFTFEDENCECETLTTVEGRLSQSMKLSHKVPAFGNHAIVNDGLLMSLYDLSKGPGTKVIKDLPISSPDHRGATGPMLYLVDVTIEYVGAERISVQAGTFDALHFKMLDVGTPEEHPEYDLWCTADGNYILLKAIVTGYMQTHYELSELAFVASQRPS